MLSFQKRGKAYLCQSSETPRAPFSASASARRSRCSVSQQSVNRKQVNPRATTCVPAQCPSEESTHLLSQTCGSEATASHRTCASRGRHPPFRAPVLSARKLLRQLCSEGLQSRDKTLSCSPPADVRHYHPAFPVLQSANCRGSQQLVAGAACGHMWLR